MALGKIFEQSFEGDTGTTRSWEIHKQGGSGSSTLVGAGRGFVETTWRNSGENEHSPFMPSETRLRVYDNAAQDLTAELFADLTSSIDRNLVLFIKSAGGSVIWRGYIEKGDLSMTEDGLREIDITATDGLGRLGDTDFVTDNELLTLYYDRATIVSVLATCFAKTGLGDDIGCFFYTACDFYPRQTGTQLAATDDPLANTYVDRFVFRDKAKKDGDKDRPISVYEVLEDIANRFGLKILQWEGNYHAIQPHQLYNSSYRRWKYDFSGAASGTPNYSDVSPRITPSTESIERTRGTLGALHPYHGVSVTHAHGAIETLSNPGIEYVGADPHAGWTRAGITAYFADGADNYVLSIPAIDPITDFPQNQGTGAGTWNQLILDNTGTSGYAYTETVDEIKAGTSLYITGEFLPFKKGNPDGVAYLSGGRRRYVMGQVRVSNGVDPDEYLDPSDGSWTTTVTWVLLRADAMGWTVASFYNGDIIGGVRGTDATNIDGTVRVTIGPIIEGTGKTFIDPIPLPWNPPADSSGAVATVDAVLWDNVNIDIALPDGSINHESTTTTNYVDSAGRDNPVLFGVASRMGDGPVAGFDYTLSEDSAGADVTSDWEEGAITGAASGDSIDYLLSRVLLRGMRNPRKLHSATYFNLPTQPGPLDVIYRSGQSFVPLEVTYNYAREESSGTWYHVRQDGFTDDLEVTYGMGIKTSGRGGIDSGFGNVVQRLSTSFFENGSKMVTRTDDYIPSGVQTSIPVDAITEPLLNDGNRIVIVAPNLDFFEVQVSVDQAAGAGAISIEDPDNPGTGYNFPYEIPYPASIYFLEDELLTLARLGQQGFAVTVQAQALGEVDGAQSGTLTSLTVRNWIGSIDSGESVYLADGTELVLSANIRRGDTTLSFGSTALTLADGVEIFASGQVRRTEFLVTSDKITAFVERSGDQIGIVTAASGGASATITVGGGLAAPLIKGDTVFIHYVNSASEQPGSVPGQVNKRVVAADAAAAAISFTVTSPIDTFPGDVIVPSYMAGVRIDMNGVGIENTHIYNTGANGWLVADGGTGVVDDTGAITTPGNQGWIITATGEAEFNDVTVRGTIYATAGEIGNLLITGTLDLRETGSVIADVVNYIPGATQDFLDVQDSTVSVGGIQIKSTAGNFSQLNLWTNSAGADIRLDAQAGSSSVYLSAAQNLSFQNLSGTYLWPIDTPSDGQILTWNTGGTMSWEDAATGVTTFTGLTDTPANYTSAANKFARVNAGATALEFVAAGSIALSGFSNDLASTSLTDTANIAYLNQNESITGLWKFAGTGALGLNNVTSGATVIYAPDTGANTITLPSGTVTLATTAQIANSGNWDTAYGWGNHASAGYLTASSSPTISGTWKFGLTRLTLENTVSGATTLNAGASSGAVTITLPSATSTLLSSLSGISALANVTISGLADGEILLSSSGSWINRTFAEAGIPSTSGTNSWTSSNTFSTVGGLYLTGATSGTTQLAASDTVSPIITLPSSSGTLLLSGGFITAGVGSAGGPTIRSDTYTTTGLYWLSGPSLNVTVSGSQVAQVTSSAFTFLTAYPSSGRYLLNDQSSEPAGAAQFGTLWASSNGVVPRWRSETRSSAGINICHYTRHDLTSVAESTASTECLSGGKGTTTIASDGWVQGATFRIKSGGTITCAGSGTLTWTLRFDGQTIDSFGPAVSVFGSLEEPWVAEIDLVVQSVSGSTVTFAASGRIYYGTASGTALSTQEFCSTTGTGITVSGDADFSLLMALSSATSNNFKIATATLEQLY